MRVECLGYQAWGDLTSRGFDRVCVVGVAAVVARVVVLTASVLLLLLLLLPESWF